MIKKLTKRIFLTLLYWSGFMRVYLRLSEAKVIVMCGHGVMDYSLATNWRPLRKQLDVAVLREQLGLLSRYFDFVDMNFAVDALIGRQELKRSSIAITFDDGYQNNFEYAVPILREFKCPATYYVVTEFLDSSRTFWFDRLDFAFQSAWQKNITLKIDGQTHDLGGLSPSGLESLYGDIRTNAKKKCRSDKEFYEYVESLARDLEHATGETLAEVQSSDPWSAIVSKVDLRMAANDEYVEIGSHTMNHVRLTCTSHDIVMTELSDSKTKVEEITGSECKHFAYPNGEHNKEISRLVKNSGYQSAVTTTYGVNSIGCDVYRLHRIAFPTKISAAELLARVSGLEQRISDLLSAFTRNNNLDA